MKSLALTIGLMGLEAAAFPNAMLRDMLEKRQVGVPSTAAAVAVSKGRGNCGLIPCTTFDGASQLVSVSGSYEWTPPQEGDIRGPCPGLNAAANHNYLPHSGVATIEETVAGLGAAYGMAAPLAAALAAYAIIFDGDPVLGTWSIGGPPPADPLTAGLIGGAQGISYSHNNYEGDTSIGRNDAYLNHGDAYSLNVTRFAEAYATGLSDDRYTLDGFAQHFLTNVEFSVANNPFYFAAPFATTVVAPAAYNFVINFMSNHSAEEPNGYLNGAIFKEFFAVSGDYPNFTWQPGYERIPSNWYKRSNLNQYEAVNVFDDVAVNYAAYPNSLRVGGNVNGVNTYEGVDLGNLTGGVYNTADLLNYQDSSGAACFYTQVIQAVIPDAAATALGELSAITNLLNNYIITPLAGNLSCAEINQYDQTLFNKFPGYHYDPTGPTSN